MEISKNLKVENTNQIRMVLLNADTLVDATKSLKYKETGIFNEILKTSHQEEVIHKHLCVKNMKEKKLNGTTNNLQKSDSKTFCVLLIVPFTRIFSSNITSSNITAFSRILCSSL